MNISIIRKRTSLFSIVVTKSDGTPQPLAGTVLDFYAGPEGTVFHKSSGGSPPDGIIITSPSGGLATLQIDALDTASYGDGVSIVPCELTLTGSGDVYSLYLGTLTISGDVE